MMLLTLQSKLLHFLERKKQQSSHRAKNAGFARHKNFGGSYTVQNISSISGNSMVTKLVPKNLSHIQLGYKKSRNTQQKDAFKIFIYNQPHSSDALKAICEFSQEMLTFSFNKLFSTIISHGPLQFNDSKQQIAYYHFLWFFTTFAIDFDEQIELVGNVLCDESIEQLCKTFKMVGSNLKEATDAMGGEEKCDFPAVLHAATLFLKCLFKSVEICLMDDCAVQKLGFGLNYCKKLLYFSQIREALIYIIKNHTPLKTTILHLNEIFETINLIFSVLDLCSSKSPNESAVQFSDTEENAKDMPIVDTEFELKIQSRITARRTNRGPSKSAAMKSSKELQSQWKAFRNSVLVTVSQELNELELVGDEANLMTEEDVVSYLRESIISKDSQAFWYNLRLLAQVWPSKMVAFYKFESTAGVMEIADYVVTSLCNKQNKWKNVDAFIDNGSDDNEVVEEESPTYYTEDFLSAKMYKALYVDQKTIDCLNRSLKYFQSNSELHNECLFNFIDCLAFKLGFYPLFFSVQLLKCLSTTTSLFKYRQSAKKKYFDSIIDSLLTKYAQAVQQSPSIVISSLFAKNIDFCFEVIDKTAFDSGDAQTIGKFDDLRRIGKRKKARAELSDEVKLQVNHLFHEYVSQSTSEYRPLEFIIKNLVLDANENSSISRTKITRHLLAEGLITSKQQLADLNKKGVWTVHQDAQLVKFVENQLNTDTDAKDGDDNNKASILGAKLHLDDILKSAQKSLFKTEKVSVKFLKERIFELKFNGIDDSILQNEPKPKISKIMPKPAEEFSELDLIQNDTRDDQKNCSEDHLSVHSMSDISELMIEDKFDEDDFNNLLIKANSELESADENNAASKILQQLSLLVSASLNGHPFDENLRETYNSLSKSSRPSLKDLCSKFCINESPNWKLSDIKNASNLIDKIDCLELYLFE